MKGLAMPSQLRSRLDYAIGIGKCHAVLPPGHRDNPLWWRLVAPMILRSQRMRAFVYELPRSRVRTAMVVRYFRDTLDAIGAGNIDSYLPTIADDASVTLFDMEDFRGPSGAREAVRQWQQSFPGLTIEMSELINPDGPDVLCVGRATGDGVVSGAHVDLDLMFRLKVIDGTAVELSLSNNRAEALEAVGLRE
jgi:hypothetical protein